MVTKHEHGPESVAVGRRRNGSTNGLNRGSAKGTWTAISPTAVKSKQLRRGLHNKCLDEDCTCCLVLKRSEASVSPSITVVPFATEDGLRTKMAACLDAMHLGHCWFAYVPSHIGRSSVVDTAAEAMCHAYEYYARDRGDELSHTSALKSYSKAINMIQQNVAKAEEGTSDTTILAIALLTHYEMLANNDRKAYSMHWAGVGSLLLSRPLTCITSELIRAMIFSMWDYNFRIPWTRGLCSPFDGDERWLNLDPVFVTVLPDLVYRLKKLSQQMLIRLPRLMSLVRTLRETEENASEALRLATLLSKCRDVDAESGLLHRVKVVATEADEDSIIVPYSFGFSSPDEMTAATLYWQTRLMVIKLCLRIVCFAEASDAHHAGFDIQTLEAEQTRALTNILMCWQDASSRGVFGTVTFSQAFVAVWGALEGKSTFRDLPAAAVKNWVLQRFYNTMGREPGDNAADLMTRASEQLAGGKVTDWAELWQP